MLPSIAFEIREYIDAAGRSPFARWFDRLDEDAASRVTTALRRMGQGNLSNTKGLVAGVFEHKLNFGPGYRIYFGRDGDKLIILLGGGTKSRQEQDIQAAVANWRAYKRAKE
jgi:putative addiction module killer protein